MPNNVKDTEGDWTFITPIGNLTLTEAVKNEFRVDRVLFVSKEKLPRIRKRLGLDLPISKIRKGRTISDFLGASETYAVIRHNGSPAEIESKCLTMVKDELSILTASQLGYTKRKSTSFLNLAGEHRSGHIKYAFLNKNGQTWFSNWKMTRSPGQLVLDARWKKYQENTFFLELLKILNRQTTVSPKWRDELRTAAILIGQSINSHNQIVSFLWNMIAIEILLTQPGDKYSDSLPERVEAFLGWFSSSFQSGIKEAYQKRCRFVHNGEKELITKKDVLFTDDLLLNLLMNLVNYPELFNSKIKIVEFAEKVRAEQILGLKPKVRPKGLKLLSPSYTKEDYAEI